VLDQTTLNVEANGIRIAYRVVGPPDAEPMVLVHGTPSNGLSWRGVAGALAETHRVHIPDLRGHGKSGWPGEYRFESMRDDLIGFLEALGLDRIVLIGHSLGGTVALLAAAKAPERVARLVLEDSAPPPPGRPRMPPRTRPEGELDYDWAMTEAVRAQFNDPDPAWTEQAADVRARTLVLAGGPPSHVPQEYIADIAARIPDSVLKTIPVGHLIHRDRPDEFVAAVRAFLTEAPEAAEAAGQGA
jgi:pimeloyl-ACP methyl ester carboxylesterase